MSTLNETDILFVERNGQLYQITSDQMSTLNDTDLLLVERSGTLYKIEAQHVSTQGSFDTPVDVLTPVNGAGLTLSGTEQPLTADITAVGGSGAVTKTTSAITDAGSAAATDASFSNSSGFSVDLSSVDDDAKLCILAMTPGTDGGDGGPRCNDNHPRGDGGDGGDSGDLIYREMTVGAFRFEYGSTFTYDETNNFGGTVYSASGGNGGTGQPQTYGGNGGVLSVPTSTLNDAFPGLVFSAGSRGTGGNNVWAGGGGGGAGGLLITLDQPNAPDWNGISSIPTSPAASNGGQGNDEANGGTAGTGWGSGGGGGGGEGWRTCTTYQGGAAAGGICIVYVTTNRTLTFTDNTNFSYFQVGDVVQAGAAIVSKDASTNEMLVDGGSFTAGDTLSTDASYEAELTFSSPTQLSRIIGPATQANSDGTDFDSYDTSAITTVDADTITQAYFGTNQTISFTSLADDELITLLVITDGASGGDGGNGRFDGNSKRGGKAGTAGGAGGVYFRTYTKSEYVAAFSTDQYTQSLTNNFSGTELKATGAPGASIDSSVDGYLANGANGSNGSSLSIDYDLLNGLFGGDIVFSSGTPGNGGAGGTTAGDGIGGGGGNGGNAGLVITSSVYSVPSIPTGSDGADSTAGDYDWTNHKGTGATGFGAGGVGGVGGSGYSGEFHSQMYGGTGGRPGQAGTAGINVVVIGTKATYLTFSDNSNFDQFAVGDIVQGFDGNGSSYIGWGGHPASTGYVGTSWPADSTWAGLAESNTAGGGSSSGPGRNATAKVLNVGDNSCSVGDWGTSSGGTECWVIDMGEVVTATITQNNIGSLKVTNNETDAYSSGTDGTAGTNSYTGTGRYFWFTNSSQPAVGSMTISVEGGPSVISKDDTTNMIGVSGGTYSVGDVLSAAITLATATSVVEASSNKLYLNGVTGTFLVGKYVKGASVSEAAPSPLSIVFTSSNGGTTAVTGTDVTLTSRTWALDSGPSETGPWTPVGAGQYIETDLFSSQDGSTPWNTAKPTLSADTYYRVSVTYNSNNAASASSDYNIFKTGSI